MKQEDKAKALKKTGELAKLAKNPSKPENKDESGDILTWFKGIIAGIPVAAAAANGLRYLIDSLVNMFSD